MILKLESVGGVNILYRKLVTLVCTAICTGLFSRIMSLLQALYDYQPSVNDNQLSQAWISTMEKAYINLGRYIVQYIELQCTTID